MLGFATVDLSISDHTLTVWLTSPGMDIEVAHTNAVNFDLSEDEASRKAWSMTCDRYVVLTDRSLRDHVIFAKWDATPCDLAIFAKQATIAQETIMSAFVEYTAKPGKDTMVEPTLLPVPAALDQTALDGGTPLQLTLAVADQVKGTWIAWLAAERERVKRWSYMPGGQKGEIRALLPKEFIQQSIIQPVRAWVP